MRYWDASALVPLIVAEPVSDAMREHLAEDDRIATWVWSCTEIVSAVERRARAGAISPDQRLSVLRRLLLLADSWDEVTDTLAVRSRANSLLARYPLRAADAGQLGAALLLQEHSVSALPFVCLDRRLSAAARHEGLQVLGPAPGAGE